MYRKLINKLPPKAAKIIHKYFWVLGIITLLVYAVLIYFMETPYEAHRPMSIIDKILLHISENHMIYIWAFMPIGSFAVFVSGRREDFYMISIYAKLRKDGVWHFPVEINKKFLKQKHNQN